MNPVGHVRSPRAGPVDDDWGAIEAVIELDARFGPASLLRPGAPVLDLKPYLRQFAPRGDVRRPSWVDELMADSF